MSNLRHVVLLSFYDICSPEEISQTKKALCGLKNNIPGIKSVEFGTNISREMKNKFFTHCYIFTFHSESDRDEYITNPYHVDFQKLYAGYLSQVLVIDFWASEKC